MPKTVAPPKPKPKFEKKELPYLSDLDIIQTDMDELGDEIVALTAKINALEEEKKEKSVLVRAIMESIDDSKSWSVRADDERWTAVYVRPADRKTLVQEKLIEHLVAAKVPMKTVVSAIRSATKSTPSTPFVQFQVPKEE